MNGIRKKENEFKKIGRLLHIVNEYNGKKRMNNLFDKKKRMKGQQKFF